MKLLVIGSHPGLREVLEQVDELGGRVSIDYQPADLPEALLRAMATRCDWVLTSSADLLRLLERQTPAVASVSAASTGEAEQDEPWIFEYHAPCRRKGNGP